MFDEMQDPKARTAEDYVQMAKRQRWVILSTVFVCWAIVWIVGWVLPSSYQSVAVIAVQPQQVSPNLVEPNTLETAETELDDAENKVLSAPHLQAIIDQYHLYPRHSGLRGLFDPADPVRQMQEKDIQIIPLPGPGQKNNNNKMTLTAFQISYMAHSPELAQAVNRELTDQFVHENNMTQTDFSQSTTAFLKTQLDDAQTDLNSQEAAVKAFKAHNMGELPDQVQSNLQILSGLQAQLQSNERALSGAQQQKLYLESIVQQYQSAQSDLGTGDSAVAPSTLDKQLKDLEMQLAQERSQYTDNYPDVIALKDQIEKTKELKKQTEDQIASDHKPGTSANSLPEGAATQVQNGAPTPMMQIQSQLKSNQLEIQSLTAAQKRIQAEIGRYQGYLDAAPKVEQALSEISRGYTEASKNYDSLLQRYQDSQLASNLPAQQGQYSISTPATLPTAPSAPNHLLVSLGGLAAGIVLGVGLAALIELTDARIRKETDLEGLVSARVLVGIPTIITAAENRRRAMHRWIERGVVFAMFVILVAGNIYSFYRG